ncbi:COX15/CtaA family protein [Gimibacter soli]|uniref:Heme A synthase n=1 Tax=Gimibacter soli TaxID=3024400 RepID=A0AAE9XM65_9PROT|nr:COX15/CtaA family protein [Gimibacter soli]WCL52826.1 COX15/CtaA family protein [Gimibacter soli]
MNQSAADKNSRAVGYWLMAVAAIVFIMVVVGGITRLTESGLSIVRWEPVTGALPPLTDEAWKAEFQMYQESPEYKLKNAGMSLEDFKDIYFWEWLHRNIGRFIGLAYFLPLVWFWGRGHIPEGLKPRLVVLFLLGGAQGAMGWYMVMSGLVDEPSVSHYRLTAHLSLALLLFALLFWTGLSLLRPRRQEAPKGLKILTHISMTILVLQIVMGALVAGLKAGYIFNTWPLMGDSFVPSVLLDMEPVWRNFLDNAVTVQFDHRIGAYILAALALVIGVRAWAQGGLVRQAGAFVLLTVFAQIVLGIVMLLAEVPVHLGAAHQGGGVVVLAAFLNLMHVMRKGAGDAG